MSSRMAAAAMPERRPPTCQAFSVVPLMTAPPVEKRTAVAMSSIRARKGCSATARIRLLGAGLQLVALFAQHGFTAELDFIAFERKNLHQDLVALFELVAHVAD